MTPAQSISRFLSKFDPSMARRIRGCRTALRKRLPTAVEMVYDNYNFFVIGYGPNDRPSDAVVSIAANAKGVGLCFIHGAKLPDPDRVLLGSGNQTRFVRLPDARKLDEPPVARLLTLAVAGSRVPFPESGRGRTIIKSISKKQRPRR